MLYASMQLSFSPVSESDRLFFLRVHHEAYRAVIESMFGWDEALQDTYANRAFDAGGMQIVSWGGEPAGVVGFEDHPEYLWLKEVFLLPEFQGRGIGSAIVQMSIFRAQAAGKEIRLQTLRANLGAKRLYERHGFIVTQESPIHWKMGRR